MSSLIKSVFNFGQSAEKDQKITSKIAKVQGLVRDLQRQKHHDISSKVKNILNLTLKEQNGESLFQLTCRSSIRQSPIQWIPVIGKVIDLLGPNSNFMKIVLQAQDYKIPIETHLIPNYLFKNNILTQKTGYLNITHSISGRVVPLLDYVFIRLAHAIFQLPTHEISREANEQYLSDEFYFYMSRNPYLLLLRSYLQEFSSAQRNLKRLVGNLKMFFVDQILIKHRINKSSSYLRNFSLMSLSYKIQPHYFLVVFLILKKARNLFEQKDLYFNEIIQRFSYLIDTDSDIFFRFFLRIFIFSFTKHSIENDVIDSLQKANIRDGYFQLERYSTDQFTKSIRNIEKRQIVEYENSKTLLLKLLQKDSNMVGNGKIHLSLMRNLECFMILHILLKPQLKKGFNQDSVSDSHQINSQTVSLQIAICRIHRYVKVFLKKQNAKKSRDFTKKNQIQLNKQLENLHMLYFDAYNRKIDLKRLEDSKEDSLDRSFNIHGQNKDFTTSIQTFKKNIEQNCWKIPLKDSEYQILYDLLYGLAKRVDFMIPGHGTRKIKGLQPALNLRYFCNPIVFMITVVVLMLIFKIVI